MYKQFLVFCFLTGVARCANILGATIFPSYSHQVVYQSVWKELALRGHQVVVITAFPERNPTIPNLLEIDISFSCEMWKKRKVSTSSKEMIGNDFHIFGDIIEKTFALPEVKELLNGNYQFDLVISEWLHAGFFGLSAKFNCPLVGISSLELLDGFYQDIGNPTYPAVHPNFGLPFTENLTFWERTVSLDYTMWMRNTFDTTIYPRSDEITRKYIGKNIPPTKDLGKNVSMVFVNTNPIFSKPRANVPRIVEVSGLHMKPPKALPKHLQEFLDNASEGVVYVSFGSNIRSSIISKELKQVIVETLNELPYQVLWKFEESNITNLGDNIKIVNWLPQQDVLAHSNVKVFVTQGGLQSLEEAIRKKVPLVGIPFFVDQPRNVKKLTDCGIGQGVDRSTVTKETLKRTILEVAENKMYKRNIEKLANILEDVPMTALDTVIWWTEYIIRHKGTPHLRSPFLDTPWYQYLHFDIVGLLILCAIVMMFVLFYTVKYIIKSIRRLHKQKIQ